MKNLKNIWLSLLLAVAPFTASALVPNSIRISQANAGGTAWLDKIFPTANGGVLITGLDGVPTMLAPGASGYVLGMYSGSPAWISPSNQASTLASLKATSVSGLANGSPSVLLGRLSAGDGYGATYFYNSSSSETGNDDTVVTPNSGSGRWIKLQARGVASSQESAAHLINIVAEGDSLTAGGYPALLANMSYAINRATVTNVATSGYVLSQIVARYTSTVYPYSPAVTGKPAWLLLWIGSNDAAALSNPTTWASQWTAYLTQARTDGFKIAVMTIMRRADIDESEDWNRITLNTTIRKNVDLYDACLDMASLVDPSTTASPFYHDSIHLNTLGYTYVSQMMNYALANSKAEYANDTGFIKPANKWVLNTGLTSTALVSATASGTTANQSFFTPSGVGSQFFSTRIYYDGSANFSIQTSPTSAFGSESYTSRMTFDYLGAITFNAPINFGSSTLTFRSNQITWASVNKTGSSLADLATRSATDLATGTLNTSRLPSLVQTSAFSATGTSAPASGSSVETFFNATYGGIRSYNRTGASGLPLTLNDTGGNVLVGTATDSANGKVQIPSSGATTGLALGTAATEVIYRLTAATLKTGSSWIVGGTTLTLNPSTDVEAITFNQNAGSNSGARYIWSNAYATGAVSSKYIWRLKIAGAFDDSVTQEWYSVNGSSALAFSLTSAGVLAVATATDATTGGAGSITTAGGISATKAIVSNSATDSTSLTTGGGIFAGGVGVSKTLTALHFAGGGTAPSVASGTGAGTTPTVTLSNAHDAAFTLNVTTGTLPTLSGVIATVTFNTAYASAPHFSLTPSNSLSAALSGVSMVIPSSTTTTFVLTAGTTALAASTTYTWEVLIHQ